jgi:hypothetical protein
MEDVANLAFEFVESRFGISRSGIVSGGRDREFVSARIVFSIACRKYGLSISEIARCLKKDHTTVMHYLDTADDDETNIGSLFNYSGEIRARPPLDSSGGIFPINDAYRRVYEAYNYTCAIPGCGRGDVLEIHHINGRKIKNSNAMENLIVLCPTHHALADRGMIFMK